MNDQFDMKAFSFVQGLDSRQLSAQQKEKEKSTERKNGGSCNAF